MAKVTWINFLHIYQPPKQEQEVIDKIVKESYSFLLDLLKNNKNLKVTLNINASLSEQLVKFGYSEIIEGIKKYAKEGNIEFTGSAAYHPILPLIGDKETIRQIALNTESNEKIFGKIYKPVGFFCPEMAYSKQTGEIIKKLGFKWIILDEYASKKNINPKILYTDIDTKLKVILRDRILSDTYVPDSVNDLLNKDEQMEYYVVTATDGEMYGHHHKDKRNIFQQILKNENLENLTISEYLKNLKIKENIVLRKSTWSTTAQDYKNNNPYSLWNDKDNVLHKKMWYFTKKIIKTVQENLGDSNYMWARHHLDIGLASCTFWWCSKRIPSPFCPITWNPDEVEKGLGELMKSIRSLQNIDRKKKINFEHIYYDIKKEIWVEHWSRS